MQGLHSYLAYFLTSYISLRSSGLKPFCSIVISVAGNLHIVLQYLFFNFAETMNAIVSALRAAVFSKVPSSQMDQPQYHWKGLEKDINR
jgi:hypothetical protein